MREERYPFAPGRPAATAGAYHVMAVKKSLAVATDVDDFCEFFLQLDNPSTQLLLHPHQFGLTYFCIECRDYFQRSNLCAGSSSWVGANLGYIFFLAAVHIKDSQNCTFQPQIESIFHDPEDPQHGRYNQRNRRTICHR